MKKLKILTALLIPLLLLASLAPGCGVILVPNDGEVGGQIETRRYDFTEFTSVNIGSAFDYEIRYADNFSIDITTSGNMFDEIRVLKDGETLDISMDFPGIVWTPFNITPRVNAVITMPLLRSLDSSGATRGAITGFRSGENMEVKVSGASDVELNEITTRGVTLDISGASKVKGEIEAQNMELSLSGASSVKLRGSADSLVVGGSGASDLDLADLKSGDADITLSGASDATINLNGNLDVDLSGASKLEYIGDPTLGSTHITGASNIKKK